MRRLLTAAGVALAVFGLLAAFVPSAVPPLTVGEFFLVGVGLLALLQGLRQVGERRDARLTQAETGDPETTQDLPVPGAEFDEQLAALYSGNTLQNKEEIRDRLHTAAVTAVSHHEGISREAAAERVADGTWTDDGVAAAFFTGSIPRDVPLRTRVRLVATLRPKFRRRARRAAHAVADLAVGGES